MPLCLVRYSYNHSNINHSSQLRSCLTQTTMHTSCPTAIAKANFDSWQSSHHDPKVGYLQLPNNTYSAPCFYRQRLQDSLTTGLNKLIAPTNVRAASSIPLYIVFSLMCQCSASLSQRGAESTWLFHVGNMWSTVSRSPHPRNWRFLEAGRQGTGITFNWLSQLLEASCL